MADPRTAYLSAYRGLRTRARPITPPSVPSPVGAQTSATVQAEALRNRDVWGELPENVRLQLQDAYGKGGFEGVKNVEGWFDVPEHVRRQLLTGLSRI